MSIVCKEVETKEYIEELLNKLKLKTEDSSAFDKDFINSFKKYVEGMQNKKDKLFVKSFEALENALRNLSYRVDFALNPSIGTYDEKKFIKLFGDMSKHFYSLRCQMIKIIDELKKSLKISNLINIMELTPLENPTKENIIFYPAKDFTVKNSR